MPTTIKMREKQPQPMSAPKCEWEQQLPEAIIAIEETLVVLRSFRKEFSRSDYADFATRLSAHIPRCLQFFSQFSCELDDEGTERKEKLGMEAQILAVISLQIGHVVEGDAQPAVININTSEVRKLLESVEKVSAEVNEEIRDQVPILGERDDPKPLEHTDENNISALGHVLAARTDEKVQLTILPEVLRELLVEN